MRCAFISDIHGNMMALEAVWADLEAQSVDAIYCAGDLVGYGSNPNEVIDFIGTAGISAVMGDFDEAIGFNLSARDHYHPEPGRETAGHTALRWNKKHVGTNQKRYLRSLPLQLRERHNGLKFLLVHGSPRSLSEYVFEDRSKATFAELAKYAGCDLIVFGHTGQAYLKKVNETYFLNAGSVGGRPDAHTEATYWLVDLKAVPRFQLQTVRYAAPAFDADPGLADLPTDGARSTEESLWQGVEVETAAPAQTEEKVGD